MRKYHNVRLEYPDLIEPENREYVLIELMHVRSADDIRVSYDGDRDGWSVEQSYVAEMDGDENTLKQIWEEVAFVKAWGLQEEKGCKMPGEDYE